MIEVEVSSVSFSPTHGGYVVLLHHKEAGRWLPIFVGAGEAQAISLNLQQLRYPRPMTWDLVTRMIDKLNGRIRRVAITALREDTFYAEVDLQRPDGELLTLDARPSDAIALALRQGLPILMNPMIMAAAGHDGAPELVDADERLARLESELERSVAVEDFEKAARLRDQIKQLKERQNPGETHE